MDGSAPDQPVSSKVEQKGQDIFRTITEDVHQH